MNFDQWWNTEWKPPGLKDLARAAWKEATKRKQERCEVIRFAIVNGIIEDLSDRRGLSQEWDHIESDIRDEIIREWLDIALAAIRKE